MDSRLGCKIPQPVAAFWLSYLVDQKMAELQSREDWPWFSGLVPARQQVLVLLDYNEGLGSLLGFSHMLFDLAAGDYDSAANELKNSLWYREVGPTRGDKYVNIMRTGVWQ